MTQRLLTPTTGLTALELSGQARRARWPRPQASDPGRDPPASPESPASRFVQAVQHVVGKSRFLAGQLLRFCRACSAADPAHTVGTVCLNQTAQAVSGQRADPIELRLKV